MVVAGVAMRRDFLRAVPLCVSYSTCDALVMSTDYLVVVASHKS